MGKKYIVEIGRLERLYKAFVSAYGKPKITWLSPEVDLTPYTEPDLDAIRKEAYEEGRKVGIKDGMCEAWEVARKVVGLEIVNRRKVFGTEYMYSILEKNTATEAIEKIRQYEQEKGKIQVGDEVENTQTGVKFIVTHLWKNNRGEQGVSGFNQECSAFSTTLSLVVKTGRHFPEITEVLQKMKES